jgi:malonyl CoA-acyl carrier protein transacylase
VQIFVKNLTKNIQEASKNIKTLLNSLGPMAQFSGMDPSAIKNAFDTLDSQKINTNTSVEIEETIKIANYARDILTSVMSGKPVNITEFKRVKEEIEKKYKK